MIIALNFIKHILIIITSEKLNFKFFLSKNSLISNSQNIHIIRRLPRAFENILHVIKQIQFVTLLL